MALIVQKFGGTSLDGLARIEAAAEIIFREHDQGHQVVAVVSAMAGVTNQLVSWVRGVAGAPGNPEHDVVASTGEQVTAGLLALALQKRGIKSRSWTGPQIPIQTNAYYGAAEIIDIPCEGLKAFLQQGGVSVVTGFQGLSPEGRLTTLGRGGSDTTAVALAGALRADRCDIYTDVEGVFTADPRVVEEAQKIEALSYDEMLALSDHGAKVLHPHAVCHARKHGVPVRVLSSATLKPGTLISVQESSSRLLFGLTYTLEWVLVGAATPFPFERVTCSEVVYEEGGVSSPFYRAVFPHIDFASTSCPLLTGVTVLQDNLAAISLIGAGLSKTDRGHLRARFLMALSDPEFPQIYMRATGALQWQVWVSHADLPPALRFLHRRLQAL